MAHLLITRTAVFVGYSLDDPDFRQIWQVVGERLGKSRRLAYTVLVDARPTEIARFERRGVKVISLPGKRSEYGQVLTQAFNDLREYLYDKLIPASQITEEDPLKELSLPRQALTRLCFFAVPFALLSFYKEMIFPLAERYGFVPVTAEDVVTPGENIMAKVDAIIERSEIIVVDASSASTLTEMRVALARDKAQRTLIVLEQGATIPFDLREQVYVQRPVEPFVQPDEFLIAVGRWFAGVAEELGIPLSEEPNRLLELREYRAAVISAITLLEATLRTRLEQSSDIPARSRSKRPRTLPQLLDLAIQYELIDERRTDVLRSWINLRNLVVHGRQSVSRNKAKEVVNGVADILLSLR